MTVLVTGASGVVGLNLVEALLGEGETVAAFSTLPIPPAARAAFATLPGSLKEIAGDVRDRAAIDAAVAATRPAAVVHAAAATPGARQESERFAATVEINIAGTAHMLEAASRAKVERFVLLSSGAVYGDNAFAPGLLDEDKTVPAPATLYAVSKYAAERLGLRYRAIARLNLVAARIGTVFGPWERDTGMRETLSPMYRCLKLAEAGREAILERASLRDWIYSRDAAGAICALLKRRAPEPHLFNVGPGEVSSVEAWCDALAAQYPGFRWRIAAHPGEANVEFHGARDRSPYAVARLFEHVGFRPQFPPAAAYADYIAWAKGAGRGFA